MKRTPLYEEHLKLKARMVDFSGWEMPVFYTNVIEEHMATRKKAAIFDICHMGEFFITGKDAKKFLNFIITNDVNKLEDGRAFYSVMCNEQGGVIDDLFIYRFHEQKFMMVVNAGTLEKDFDWLMKHEDNFDVSLENASDNIGKIDPQGPMAEVLVQKLTNFPLKELKRFHFAETEIAGINTIISRTGYTGEDGFELFFGSEKAAEMWRKLLEAGKGFVKPAGLGARDTLRTEACYSLYGHELSESINPFEAGIDFVVKMDKDDFIGKKALHHAKDSSKRKIAAFEMLEKGIPRPGYEILKDGKLIGSVTSGTLSPFFNKGIGMGFVAIGESHIGNGIDIRIREKVYKAKIVQRPIYPYRGAGLNI